MTTESHIVKWLTDEEQRTGYSFVTSGGFLKEEIIIVTQKRVIFLKRNFLWVDEVSDKLWKQLASVKLAKKGLLANSTLRLRFFKYPCYDVTNCEMNPKDPPWVLSTSSHTLLSEVYIFIKEHELHNKQRRSSDQQQYNSTSHKYLDDIPLSPAITYKKPKKNSDQ